MAHWKGINMELNKVGGNTVPWMAEQDLEKDLYLCRECSSIVTEDKFNHKQCMCYQCFWKV